MSRLALCLMVLDGPSPLTGRGYDQFVLLFPLSGNRSSVTLVFSSASRMPLHRIRVHSGDPLAGAGKVLAVVSLCPCAVPE